MGESIEFRRPDGKVCPGYLALPAAGTDRPAIVVIQEWWGLNEQIRGVADRLAASGFRALVPDLYRGKLPSSSAEASHLSDALDFEDASSQDLRGAVQHLKEYADRRVGVIGFCMGGALAIIAGVHLPEIDAAVCCYGIPRPAAADPAKIRVPFVAHFAQHDDWCTPSRVDSVEQRLKEGGVSYELHRYDAKHGFMNERRPEVFDAALAELAWQRTLAFLQKRLTD